MNHVEPAGRSASIAVPGPERPAAARICAATAADRTAVLELLAAAGLTTEGIEECYPDFLVATDVERRIIGCVGLEQYGYAALVRSLAIDPARRRHGVGSLLAASMLLTARAYGIRDLFLLTETASTFFARLGFKPCLRLLVPAAVKRSVQFRYACPASALCMHRELV